MSTQLCTPEGTPCLAADGTLVKGRWGLLVLWARGGRTNRRLLSQLAPTIGLNFAHATEDGTPIPCHDQGGRVAYTVFGDEFSMRRLCDWFGLDSADTTTASLDYHGSPVTAVQPNPLFGLAPEPILGVQYATDAHVCNGSGGKPTEKPQKPGKPKLGYLYGVSRRSARWGQTPEGYRQLDRFWDSQENQGPPSPHVR